MVRKSFFILILFSLFLLTAMPLYSVDTYVMLVYKQVDVAFINKSEAELNEVLGENHEDNNYYLIENYTMKKIRRLVVEKDYNFAMKANLIVIDNNLDNEEAVELYATIANALEQQKEQERIQKEKDAAVLAKYEAEKQKQKAIAEKDFNVVKTTSGEDVFLKDKVEKYTATFWDFYFGFADVGFVNETAAGYSSIRYGISGDFNYEYTFDNLLIGGEVDASMYMLPFTNNDGTILSNIDLVPKIGFGKLGRYLTFRAGFSAILDIKDKESQSSLSDSFYTPVFGVGVNHLSLGASTFSASADYYLGSLAVKDMLFAAGMKAGFTIPVAAMEKVQLNFNIGLKDTIFVKSESIENKLGVVLAIGVQNVAN